MPSRPPRAMTKPAHGIKSWVFSTRLALSLGRLRGSLSASPPRTLSVSVSAHSTRTLRTYGTENQPKNLIANLPLRSIDTRANFDDFSTEVSPETLLARYETSDGPIEKLGVDGIECDCVDANEDLVLRKSWNRYRNLDRFPWGGEDDCLACTRRYADGHGEGQRSSRNDSHTKPSKS